MPDPAARRFAVYAAGERAVEHLVDGVSFEDAALSFVEVWHPAMDEEGEVAVIVRDAESGCEQCFRVGLEGEAAPCD